MAASRELDLASEARRVSRKEIGQTVWLRTLAGKVNAVAHCALLFFWVTGWWGYGGGALVRGPRAKGHGEGFWGCQHRWNFRLVLCVVFCVKDLQRTPSPTRQ